ncbi:MAG: DNA repair protein RadC [Candidatus Mcinerneyibacterium aminivorans]|jgi:DNA repair protein RadC|uniref:DNA repair protein RadC n=1 Tax=Candidatus Mcinerneyibacterium aminivorans TaxID=2703815 RepID=A0A5D0MFX3_9BACT|nr:MAG: DNA repair protein RadC [Candidatus Mcinerneyibacterium aminivorans]
MPTESRGHKKRLRKKFRENGIDALHDYEILEFYLGLINVRKDTKDLAKKLIAEYETVSNVLDAKIDKLLDFKGLGSRTATALKFSKELITYYLRENIENQTYTVNSPESAIQHFVSYYGSHEYEEFCVMYLDGKNNIQNIINYQKGSINYSQVYPKKIIKKAIENNSVSIVLVHNHPSGNLQPSQADINFTHKMENICQMLDITLLDHLIIAQKDYFSLKEHGHL